MKVLIGLLGCDRHVSAMFAGLAVLHGRASVMSGFELNIAPGQHAGECAGNGDCRCDQQRCCPATSPVVQLAQ